MGAVETRWRPREIVVETQTQRRRVGAAAAHPLAELLACPPETGSLLSEAARSLSYESGETIFRQGQPCRGLYVVIAGQLQRRTERLDAQLTLGQVRVGELVELASVLGDGRHTYTLKALSIGTLLLLPMITLQQAFSAYPPLRMQLLQELAREVSRAYETCFTARLAGMRRRRVDASFSSGTQETR